jgi:hypothetical protein
MPLSFISPRKVVTDDGYRGAADALIMVKMVDLPERSARTVNRLQRQQSRLLVPSYRSNPWVCARSWRAPRLLVSLLFFRSD